MPCAELCALRFAKPVQNMLSGLRPFRDLDLYPYFGPEHHGGSHESTSLLRYYGAYLFKCLMLSFAAK